MFNKIKKIFSRKRDEEQNPTEKPSKVNCIVMKVIFEDGTEKTIDNPEHQNEVLQSFADILKNSTDIKN